LEACGSGSIREGLRRRVEDQYENLDLPTYLWKFEGRQTEWRLRCLEDE
jgi:hypothetical protein